MNLDQSRVRVRERTMGEVLDLAIVFIKSDAVAYGKLFLLVIVPASVLVYWLVNVVALDSLYFYILIMVLATPMVRYPILLYASSAMFDSQPSLKNMTVDWLGLQSPIITRLLLPRLLGAVFVLAPIFEIWWRYFAEEIVLLERVSGKQFGPRLRNLQSKLSSEAGGLFFAHLVFGSVMVGSAYLTWLVAAMLFESHFRLATPETIHITFPFILLYLTVQAFLAVSKFLYYLNLRTVHEGWELFLEVRKYRTHETVRGLL